MMSFLDLMNLLRKKIGVLIALNQLHAADAGILGTYEPKTFKGASE